MLQGFGFEGWHYFDSQVVKGPNWKIAYDGYRDIYHLPILRKDTFGSNFPHRANYYPFRPHQRVSGHALVRTKGIVVGTMREVRTKGVFAEDR